MRNLSTYLLAGIVAAQLVSPARAADSAVVALEFDNSDTGATLPAGPLNLESITPLIFAYSDVKRPTGAPSHVACLRSGGSWVSMPNTLIGATGTTGSDVDDKTQWKVTCDATKRILVRFRDVVRPQFVGFRITVKPFGSEVTPAPVQKFVVTVYRDPSKSPDKLDAANIIYSRTVGVQPGNKQVWVSLADRGKNPDAGGDIASVLIEPALEMQSNTDPAFREFGIDNLHFDK